MTATGAFDGQGRPGLRASEGADHNGAVTHHCEPCMPHTAPAFRRPKLHGVAGALSLLLMLAASSTAWAAPWRSHLTLPSGDEVLLRTQGRAVQPAGSRAELDVPVRLRFAAPLDVPGGPVAMADAKLRILCKGGSVTASALKPRLADGKLVPEKYRKAAAAATRKSLLDGLSNAAVVDSLCQR